MKFDPYNAEHIRDWLEYIKTNKNSFIEQFDEKAFEIKDMIAAEWVKKILYNDSWKKKEEEIKRQIENDRKSRIAAKPKADKIIELMKAGWKLTSSYVGNGTSWSLIEQGGPGILNVNGNTADSLCRAKKIEFLPNNYPCSQSTEYKLVEKTGDST